MMRDDTNDGGDPDATDRRARRDVNPTAVRYDWTESGQPSVTIIEAVAEATDRTTAELPPLQKRVDPDALDALLTRGQSPVSIAFTYADVSVTVNGNGTLNVRVDGHLTGGDGE